VNPLYRKRNPSNCWYLLLSGLLILILLSPAAQGYAQAQGPGEPQQVTAFNDDLPCGFSETEKLHSTLTFYNVGAAGGETYSQAIYTDQTYTYDMMNDTCEITGTREIVGTFSGGPNGIITFPTPNDFFNISTCQVVEGKTIDCIKSYEDDTWHFILTIQNPEVFQATTVTAEYIYNTYGIRVEDSVGDSKGTAKSWTDHELSLLNDVLKEIPSEFLKEISLTRIIRSGARIAPDGTTKPNTYGTYYPCDAQTDPDCSGASTAIRVFDAANSPNGYFHDADKEFRSTILHEIIHAYVRHNDNGAVYTNPLESPRFQNWVDATKKNPAESDQLYVHQNGWGWYTPPGGWKYFGDPGNLPPTDYSLTNPEEDMAESAMLYVYDPGGLRAKSPARYNYIRDYLFGGAEYDNGKQK